MNFKPIQLRSKRAIDLVASLVLLVFLAVPMIAIAVLVKLDGGPVLFVAERAGRNRKLFPVFKFRSMRVDADELLDQHGRPTGNRVTAIGKFLRRFSLDELGQILNILRGEMSFIGPRPILPADAAAIAPEYEKRFDVLPGISGLAQVSGRNSLPWSRRFELDVEYVEKYSLLLDMKIIARTSWVVISGAGMVMDRNPDQARSQVDGN